MPDHIWVFPAACEKIVDGDTFDLLIDQGMHARRVERVRLLGVDTPEMRGLSRPLGQAARLYVINWMGSASNETSWIDFPLRVRTLKDPDAFGRYLADLWRVSDGHSLNEDLVTTGHAVVYRPGQQIRKNVPYWH